MSFNPVESGLIMLSMFRYNGFIPRTLFQSRGIRSDNAVSRAIKLYTQQGCCFNPVESGLIMLSHSERNSSLWSPDCFNPVESGLIMLSGLSFVQPKAWPRLFQSRGIRSDNAVACIERARRIR